MQTSVTFPKDAIYHTSLKMTQWFWRKLSIVFTVIEWCLDATIFELEKECTHLSVVWRLTWEFFINISSPIFPLSKLILWKFLVRIWKKKLKFKNLINESSLYYFIFSDKRTESSIWSKPKINRIYQRMLLPNLVFISPIMLQKFILCQQ